MRGNEDEFPDRETSYLIRTVFLTGRGSIKKWPKKLIVVTVAAYVFTDIPLLFGQSQPLLFLKNGLHLLQEKALEMTPKYGRTEAQIWP